MSTNAILLKEFLTIPQAAKKLGLSTARVRLLRQEGRFAGCVQIGRQWLVPAAEISRFSRLVRPWNRPKSNAGKGLKNLKKSAAKGQ